MALCLFLLNIFLFHFPLLRVHWRNFFFHLFGRIIHVYYNACDVVSILSYILFNLLPLLFVLVVFFTIVANVDIHIGHQRNSRHFYFFTLYFFSSCSSAGEYCLVEIRFFSSSSCYLTIFYIYHSVFAMPSSLNKQIKYMTSSNNNIRNTHQNRTSRAEKKK